MKDFDIQLFAEEEETVTDQQTTTEDQPKEEAPQEEIPQELDGLPEEVAREAMQEVEEQRKEEEEAAPAEPENSDKKPSKGGTPDNTNIPYPRFKEQVDKANSLEAQLEAYRAKFGELGANNQAPAQQQNTQQQEPSMSGVPQFTPEISQKIEEAVKQQALQMTGMTAEDASSLEEYGDDDSPQFKMLENAKSVARQMIIGEITEAVRQQQAQRAEFIRQHQSMVQDYNSFVQRESAEPDFKEVQAYATGEYFNKLSLADQAALRDAYTRTEAQNASPQDIMLVKRYFTDAKAAFYGNRQKPTQSKSAAKPKLPRASEVDGSAAAPSEGITNESLARMLDEMEPDQLPENVRKLLMG